VLYFFNPAESAFYPGCVFYKTTGLLCPGCGSLRALHQLLHGHILAALRFNALLVFSVPFTAALCAWYVCRRLQSQPFALNLKPAWLWLGFAALLLFGVLRNLPLGRAYGLAP
jgi:hypothetical protein